MSDDHERFGSVSALPLRSSADATIEANVAMLVVAVQNLTEAVRDNSRETKTLNKKIDGLASEMVQTQAAWATSHQEMRAEQALAEREVASIARAVADLEVRQQKDEQLRNKNVEAELEEMKRLMNNEQEAKRRAAEKEVEYRRSRRNYWIGIAVSVILGLISTVTAININGCSIKTEASAEEMSGEGEAAPEVELEGPIETPAIAPATPAEAAE